MMQGTACSEWNILPGSSPCAHVIHAHVPKLICLHLFHHFADFPPPFPFIGIILNSNIMTQFSKKKNVCIFQKKKKQKTKNKTKKNLSLIWSQFKYK